MLEVNFVNMSSLIFFC